MVQSGWFALTPNRKTFRTKDVCASCVASGSSTDWTDQGCVSRSFPKDDQSGLRVLLGSLDVLMSNTKNQRKTMGTEDVSPTTTLSEQLKAADFGSPPAVADEATLQQRLNLLQASTSSSSSARMELCSDDDDDDGDGDESVVRYDASFPADFVLPELGSTVVRSSGVDQLVAQIESVVPDQIARDHYAYNEVRARRARCITIDRAVIKNETDLSDLDARIATNKALEPADLAAERLGLYKSSAVVSRRSAVRKKRTRDEIGDDEERVGTSKKRKIVVPGIDKVKRVEVESYDVTEVNAELKKLEETANANLGEAARLQRRREKFGLVLLRRRLREARPDLLAKHSCQTARSLRRVQSGSATNWLGALVEERNAQGTARQRDHVRGGDQASRRPHCTSQEEHERESLADESEEE